MLRDAATLILFKNEEDGLKVLMGLRNAGHKFLPNRMAFPGGAVDPEDYHAASAAALPEGVLPRLERAATPELALALAFAAARELEEETGLSLGTPPAMAGLDYLCRAVTPEGQPIRFNVRFFVGPASLANGDIGGSGELEGLDWYSAEALLKLEVPLVTKRVLEQLQSWLETNAVQNPNRKVPVYSYPNWSEE